MKRRLPKFLQPFLWSVKIKELELVKDKIYIIHQILAFGNLKALRWLFATYSTADIKKTFLEHSLKIYHDSGFEFAKKILNVKKPLQQKKYVTAF